MTPKATMNQASVQPWRGLILIPKTLLHHKTQKTQALGTILDRKRVKFDFSTCENSPKGNDRPGYGLAFFSLRGLCCTSQRKTQGFSAMFSIAMAWYLMFRLAANAPKVTMDQNTKDRSSQQISRPRSREI